MKPINLIISAFGSYSKEVELPFSKLGSGGLYLVTGDTGAGKTTIFDAITFALYGSASGENREPLMLRSKYSAPNTKTFVDLTFSYQNRVYRVVRNPEYQRPKNRGEGTTTEKANAQLYLPDNQVLEGATQVSDKIIDIIGLDRNQFTQICMIAQGEFLKMLFASTEERAAIFRKIFNTKPILKLQEKLKEEVSLKNKEFELLKQSTNQFVSQIQIEKENKEFEMLTELAQNDNSYKLVSILEILERLIETDQKKSKQLEKETKNFAKKISETDLLLGKFEQAQNALIESQKCSKELEITKSNLTKSEEQLQNLKSQEQDITKTEKEIILLHQSLSKFEILDEKRTTFEKLSTTKKISQSSVNSLKKLKQNLEEKVKSAKLNLEKLSNIESRYTQNEKQIFETSLNYENLKQLLTLIKSYNKENIILNKAQNDFLAANSKYNELLKEFEEKEKSFYHSQAGLLASTLKGGESCPVCGSKEHPKKAQLAEESVTQEQLKQVKEKTDSAQKLMQENSQIAAKNKGTVEKINKDLIIKNKQIFNTSTLISEDELSLKIETIQCELNQLNLLKEKLLKNIKGKEELNATLPKLETEFEEVIQNFNSENNNLIKLLEQEKLLKEQIKETQKELGFESLQAAQKVISIKEKKVIQFKTNKDKLTKESDELKQKICAITARIKAYTEQGKNFNNEEFVKLKNEKENYKKNNQLAQTKLTNLVSKFQSNSKIKTELVKKGKLFDEFTKNYSWLKNLSDTANGTLQGKQKVLFETFVQMRYFDEIIAKANLRFQKMTESQYELKRATQITDLRKQSGLELEVIDHYNGTTRSIKSLSGGESFKASLCLALGLSDVIQSNSGGVRLDTMFIDEGFGSLDDNSLSAAIRILNELSGENRLVGIISHVGNLQEKIDKKIIVTKTAQGGSTATIQS